MYFSSHSHGVQNFLVPKTPANNNFSNLVHTSIVKKTIPAYNSVETIKLCPLLPDPGGISFSQITFDNYLFSTAFVLTLALVGGGGSNGPPHGFSQITRVKGGRSPRNLQYPRFDQFDTYCENFKSMSCQAIKL